ncbi:unnamed protein product [Symbiodinium sp. CCMP2456]|nr:unnamed protein product [Symbiodinium sp. CCMP2456]
MGLTKAWVNPCVTSGILGSNKFASWSKQSGKSWVVVSIEEVAPMLIFLFDNMQFVFGQAKGWQQAGVMMGIGAGGSIFRMVLVAHEIKMMLSSYRLQLLQRFPDIAFRVARFDVRVLLVFPLTKGEVWARAVSDFILNLTYPNHLKLKDDSVNPTVGMDVHVREGQLHWHAHNKTLGEMLLYGKRCQQAVVPWSSYGPPHVFEAIAKGGFARCRHLASDKRGMMHSLNGFCKLLEIQGGYPATWINKQLKTWCDQNFGTQCHLHEQILLTTQPLEDAVLNRSFNSPSICVPVGQLCLRQL